MKLFTCALIAFTLQGCVYSLSDEVTLKKGPSDTFQSTFKSHTKSAEVIDNFETKAIVTATLLSPTFLSAAQQRQKEIFSSQELILGEASGKLSFFVSVYSSDRDSLNLQKKSLWNVFAGEDSTPTAITRLGSKQRWEAIFPYVNAWTTEFLVTFPDEPKEANFVDESSVVLTLANADAKIRLRW